MIRPSVGATNMLDLISNVDRETSLQAGTPGEFQEEKTLAALLSIAKVTRAIYGIKLAAIGFHNGQDELLLAIDPAGLPVSVMAEQLMVRPSTVSKMMDRLVDKGLVERTGDARDARRTIIHLTAAGKDAQNSLVETRKAVDAELVKALNNGLPAGSNGGDEAADCLAMCAAALTKHLRRLR